MSSAMKPRARPFNKHVTCQPESSVREHHDIAVKRAADFGSLGCWLAGLLARKTWNSAACVR
jgi:hypothetical protein